jgi:gluconokinase
VFIIGIDIGTSGTKAIAFDDAGKIEARTAVSYGVLPSAIGFHEQDPDALLAAFTGVLKTLTTKLPSGSIAGVCCSCAMHSLIAVGNDHEPLTNVISWADNRSAQEAAAIKESSSGKRLALETGTPVHPMSPLCKLVWLRNNQQDVFNRAAKFISIKEYIFFRLFGEYVIDHSMASATGLFDIRTKDWHPEALKTAGITPTRLSKPVKCNAVLKGLTTEMAIATGLDAQTPFIIGATDGCLATTGSQAIHTGDCSLTIGTSGAVRMLTEKPQQQFDTLFNYILTDSLYVCGGPISNGGIVLQWYAENFLNRKLSEDNDMIWFAGMAEEAGPGADGLLFLPYLLGERAPVWDAHASAVFFGIRAQHRPQHFMRAIMEGISFALLQVMELLEKSAGPARNIYCSGGFTRSRLWLQWMADCFGKPMIVSSSGDASATGAALMGWEALGYRTSFQEQQVEAVTYSPDENATAVYRKLYPVYCSLYSSLKEQFSLLSHAVPVTGDLKKESIIQ